MMKQLRVKKEYMLIAATFVLLLVSYRFAFRNTIEAWQLNKALNVKLTQSNDLTYQPGYLERKDDNLNKIINLYKADTVVFRSNIISTISTVAEKENVKLTEVPLQDISYHTDHVIIERLDFEGDFFSLVKVVNQLQLTRNIGVVRSTNFKIIHSQASANEITKLGLEIFLEIVR